MASNIVSGATESTVSNWAAPYAANMLGQGAAYGATPASDYTAPLTAGSSPLQEQGFGGISALQGQIGPVGSVQSYMNPYISSVLNPTLQELNRQTGIQRTQMQSRLTGAGSFGGDRTSIENAELDRNLMFKAGDLTANAYKDAWDRAQGLRHEAIGDNLQGINALLGAGATQRGIEQEGLTADYQEFLRKENDPAKKLEVQKNLLTGLPISTANFYSPTPSNVNTGVAGATTALEILKQMGLL